LNLKNVYHDVKPAEVCDTGNLYEYCNEASVGNFTNTYYIQNDTNTMQ